MKYRLGPRTHLMAFELLVPLLSEIDPLSCFTVLVFLVDIIVVLVRPIKPSHWGGTALVSNLTTLSPSPGVERQ